MLCCSVKNGSNISNGIYVILTYFGLLSNLWASIIMGAYLGAILLVDLMKQFYRKTFSLWVFVHDHFYYLLVMLLWAIVQVFELNGGRSYDIQQESFADGFHSVLISIWFEDLPFINCAFLVSTLLAIIIGSVLMIQKGKKQESRDIGIWIVSFFIAAIYLILSCAKAGAGYITRPDVFYVLFLFYMLVVLLCVLMITDCYPNVKRLLPLLLIIVAVECNSGEKTFRESNVIQAEPEVIKRVGNDILNQFKMAEQAGETHLTVSVPQFDAITDDNFPLATYAGQTFGNLFYLYGAVENNLPVDKVVPKLSKNVELGLR